MCRNDQKYSKFINFFFMIVSDIKDGQNFSEKLLIESAFCRELVSRIYNSERIVIFTL